jgi:hypothetical protein
MNPQLTKLVAELRDETNSPDKSDPQWGHRNRILASMVEQLNNEGLLAFMTECQTIIGSIHLTLGYCDATPTQAHRLVTAWSQICLEIAEDK